MKFLAIVAVASGMAVAAPVVEKIAARGPLPAASVGVNLGSSSAPLVGVGLSSSTLLAVGLTSPKASSLVTMKASSTAVTAKTSSAVVTTKASSAVVATPAKSISAVVGTPAKSSLSSAKVSSTSAPQVSAAAKSSTMAITVKPTATVSYATALPSSFSAPVQGVGVLSLENLPALPGVLDSTFSGVLGTAYGLLSGACNLQYMCSISVAGNLPSLLVDGSNYGAATTLQAWCDGGRCFGSANPTVNATAPFTITCTYITGTQACSATIAGAARAIFTNGEQVELWGWITPAGYCQNGVCVASIKAFGDPMY